MCVCCPSKTHLKARAIFSRIDHDASGSLEFDEVKLALAELGADATDKEVSTCTWSREKKNLAGLRASTLSSVLLLLLLFFFKTLSLFRLKLN